jgi:hypothetical protein
MASALSSTDQRTDDTRSRNVAYAFPVSTLLLDTDGAILYAAAAADDDDPHQYSMPKSPGPWQWKREHADCGRSPAAETGTRGLVRSSNCIYGRV